MEDGIGYELFINRCLTNRGFRQFMSNLDNILSDQKTFKEIIKLWTTLREKNEENEMGIYLSKYKFPQPFITEIDSNGPFLDIVGIGVRRRLWGESQIKEYANRIVRWAKIYGLD
jgi:hypothetical protein